MTALPIFLLALAAFIAYLLIRSNEKLREREEAREHVEETLPAFHQWPPRPRPAAAPERHLGKTRIGL